MNYKTKYQTLLFGLTIYHPHITLTGTERTKDYLRMGLEPLGAVLLQAGDPARAIKRAGGQTKEGPSDALLSLSSRPPPRTIVSQPALLSGLDRGFLGA